METTTTNKLFEITTKAIISGEHYKLTISSVQEVDRNLSASILAELKERVKDSDCGDDEFFDKETGNEMYIAWELKTVNETTCFFKYMWNRWSKEECLKIFPGHLGQHFWDKYMGYYKSYGAMGACAPFYGDLDTQYASIITKRAIEIYNGAYLHN